jgi:signal transduction histidine kinase
MPQTQTNLLEYTLSELGVESINGLYLFSIIITNVILFFFLGRFVQLYMPSLVITLFISFLIIGSITKWKQYLWLSTVSIFVIELISNSLSTLTIAICIILLLVIPIAVFIGYYYIKSKKNEITISKNRYKLSLRTLIVLVILPRLLLFNIAYLSFPLLFIWLSYLGILYYAGLITVINTGAFISIVTVAGVFSGIFQYYISRREEKIQEKLKTYFVTEFFKTDEFSFEEFDKSLKDTYDYKTDKLLKELKSLVDEVNTEFSGNAKKLIDEASEKLPRLRQLSITIYEPNQTDLVKFNSLEKKVKEQKLKEFLIKRYEEFFNNKKLILVENVNIKKANKIMFALLENINLFEEAYTSFLTLPDAKDKSSSYTDFLLKLQGDIFSLLIEKSLGLGVEEIPTSK